MCEEGASKNVNCVMRKSANGEIRLWRYVSGACSSCRNPFVFHIYEHSLQRKAYFKEMNATDVSRNDQCHSDSVNESVDFLKEVNLIQVNFYTSQLIKGVVCIHIFFNMHEFVELRY